MKYFHEKYLTLEFSVETPHQFKLVFLIAPISWLFNSKWTLQGAFSQGLQTEILYTFKNHKAAKFYSGQ